MKYSGSNWIRENLPYWKCKTKSIVSPLGAEVADLLGELFFGIYHLEDRWLQKVDWSNNHHIEISIGYRSWSTVDSDTLTRLVFLAHHMCIRVDLDGSKVGYIRLLFHKRKRIGDSMTRHPTLNEAVEHFKNIVSIPEWGEDE